MLKMRPLTDEEATALKKIAHRSRDGVQRTRAKVIRAMARTGKVALAAKAGGVSPQYAREIIHRFEQDGLESLPAKHEGGRQHILDEQTIEAIRGLAGQNPKMLGTPWTCWSVAKLLTTAINKGIVPKVSQETFRQALHRGGVTYQETKTWKQSSDPEFHEKLTRVKALYDKCPIGSVVVCVDEFGPLECRPYNGRTWAECKKPVRLPATYRRTQGVQHFLAMYDVHHNFLWGWFYKRKRGEEFIEFLKRVRGAYASWVRI
ncbi:MAG TPA: IS630 family transposase, partial [Firmicutes bacterium]|nr:IS630 family transposase [Bacillota bacterium]